jgi:hypothetical protein
VPAERTGARHSGSRPGRLGLVRAGDTTASGSEKATTACTEQLSTLTAPTSG